MNTSSCCKCGVPFDLSLEAPIVYIEKPYGKATCYDCMTCTAGCETTLTNLKKNKTIWIWFDSPIEGVQCLPCIRKKQKIDFNTEPDNSKLSNTHTAQANPDNSTRTSTGTSTLNLWKIGWTCIGIGVGFFIAGFLWKIR